MKTKRLISILLVLCVVLTLLPADVVAETTENISGTCGENLTWTLIDGVLTISGSGEMYDYTYSSMPWSSYIEDITSIVLSEGISSIGNYAFRGCSNLISVSIPQSITSIGDSAFAQCNNLNDITLPDCVTHLGNGVFSGCGSLVSITIPKGVTSIDSDSFSGCGNLTSIVIPDSVTSIGTYAFYYCENLKSIDIPERVTSIGNCAFAGCSSLESITIPKGVTSIAYRAFDSCSGLTTIAMAAGVTSIGDRAFYFCSSLTTVTIPETVISIGDSAFWRCDRLSKIAFVGDAPFIADNCFTGTTATVFYPPDNITWTESVMLDYGGTITWAPTCQHTSTKLINANEATCVTSGYTGDTVCADCGETLKTGTNISVTDHSCANGICANCGEEVGTAGENLVWSFDKATGTLTVSGEGEMENYTYDNPAPWNNIGNQIVSVIIEYGVTSIADYAFSSCAGLTSVTFRGDAPTIGADAFMNVTATAYYPVENNTWTAGVILQYGGTLTWKSYADVIASGTWGENISWVLDWKGTMTFTGSGDMKGAPGWTWYDYRGSVQSVVIDRGITSVGYAVFDGHNSLTEVVMSDSVTKLGENAFQNCPLLESVKLSNNIATISGGAFYNCKSLGSITIPDGVTTIGRNAFYGCISLTEIDLPDSIVSIESSAFSSCSSLKTIDIPNGIENISGYAFNSCTSMKSIVFLGNAPVFSENAFYNLASTVYYPLGSTSWTDDVLQQYGGEIIWVAYEGEYPELDDMETAETIGGICGENLTWLLNADGTLTISGSGSMTDYGWSSGNQSPWYNNIGVTKLVVESGVLTLGNYAFRGCNNLTNVELPDSLEKIGSDAFSGCINLGSIVVPDNVVDIGNHAFDGCMNLTSVDLPDSLEKIGPDAFLRCINLGSIRVPDNVTHIGGNAFWGCISLKSVTLPDYMISIGTAAFSGCTNLVSIAIPEGITELHRTFSSCYNLESVNLPSTLLVIGDQTFNCCTSLSSLEIPDGVVIIGSHAFSECTSLENITIPESVQEMGGFFSGGSFSFCSSLENVDIPYGVRALYTSTFNDCSKLQTVTIPVTVEEIDRSAFYNCSALTDVYYTGSEEEWNEVNIESGNDLLSNATIHFFNTETKDECIIENEVRLTEGEYPDWRDRVILPPFAQEYCEWLEESADGDGESDVLISAATADGYPIVYYYDLSIPVEGQSKEELIINLARESHAAAEAIQTAHEVFLHDYPDIPLLRSAYGVAMETVMLNNNEGRINITCDIYLNSIKSEDEYYTLLKEQEKAIADILSDIPEELSIYEQIKCFNSYLTMNNGYNTSADEPDNAHYAVTALVGNYGENGPVCEAYAKAFKLLCDARGIPCELVIGKTIGAPWGVGHAWNAVQMDDGKWYAVDVTWNDPSTSVTTSPISGAETENFLLVGSVDVVEGYRFTDSHIAEEGSLHITFKNYPRLSETAYIPSASVDILPGDVNSDGKVNTQDRMILTRYLAKWTGYTDDMINMTAADVNCDGKVNTQDRMILTRYLAKWTGYEELPYTG